MRGGAAAGCAPVLYGFGFRVSGFGFRVEGFEFRVSGLGFRVSGLGFRVSGSGFRVQGFGFMGWGAGCTVVRLLRREHESQLASRNSSKVNLGVPW